MLKTHRDHLITSWINWRFRVRPVTAALFAAGLACISFSLTGGFGIKGSIPTENGPYVFDFSTGGGVPEPLIWASAILGFGLVVAAGLMAGATFRREQHAAARKKVTVIELRGLRDGTGTPLSDSISDGGQREFILLDVRQGVVDGTIVSPERAVERLSRVRDDLAAREAGHNRADLKRVFGGLAPVPLTFLAGILLDDEERLDIWDWSRHEKRWMPLDKNDNGGRFEIQGLDEMPAGSSDVALLISTSYDLDYEGIEKRIGAAMPRVRMRLTDAGPDSHWSEEKQKALGIQFFETVQKIGNSGVRRVHLFLAAQSSIVFRFGTLYDKRNLPILLAYQYEKAADPPYPWALEMPVGENSHATVRHFTAKDE